VWEKLFGLTSPRPGAIEGRENVPPPIARSERTQAMAAIAGIDIALWDIKGKAAGLPVYRVLGGENRPLFTYATGGYYRPGATNADYAGVMARMLRHGYRAVKLKTGAGTIAEEAERIAAVRREIGDEPSLMLDMNAAYDLPDCIDFAHMVEPSRIFWLEEPLHWYLQPADFARLAAATPIPLAHGERELTRFTVRDFIVEGGIRMCSSTRPAPPGLPRHCASQHWPSSTVLWWPPTPHQNCMAIWSWPCRAARLASKDMAGPRKTRSATGCSRSTRNCATGICISATSPGSASKSIGTLSTSTGSASLA
jgi:Enolase C-terminal domain-like/Mandelate racemase / muconate lactonizing enzyme, N-terminal domain